MPPTLTGLCPLLQVFDLARALGFYRDVLGFTVLQEAPPGPESDWAWLRLGDAELMLNTMFERQERPAQADASRTAAHADTTLFFHCADLDAAHSWLQQHGVAATPPVDRPYGMRQLTFFDPDGYAICLQHPRR